MKSTTMPRPQKTAGFIYTFIDPAPWEPAAWARFEYDWLYEPTGERQHRKLWLKEGTPEQLHALLARWVVPGRWSYRIQS